MPSVSVIIVSYNTKAALRTALESLTDQHEVIVVDNASTDGSPEMVCSVFPAVRLVRNDRNRGFGAANNQALAMMTGDVALFLNSDCRPEPGAIDVLASQMDDTSVVACGGMLTFPDGRLQESACTNLTLWAVFCEQSLLEKLLKGVPALSPYWVSGRLLASGSGPHEVAQVMGSCLMVRPVEKFDERFFLYCEDTELCLRLSRHGKVLYVPKARFVHELGASSVHNRWEAVARYNRGKELYFEIHHGPGARLVCLALDRAGALLRLAVWLVPAVLTLGAVKKFRTRVLMFFRVLFCPLRGPGLPPDTRPEPLVAGRPS